ncbi:MAG: hypothetical protein IT373_21850 [Polyangiaceae bacterium]|nr:hypothetical protein [Polyangiaceae bacterium]
MKRVDLGARAWPRVGGICATLTLAFAWAAGCAGEESEQPITTTTTTTSSTTSTGGSGAGGSTGTGGATGGQGGTGGSVDPCACADTAPGPTRGSAIAITPDDATLVSVNRDVGTVTISRVDYSGSDPAMTKVAELAVGEEPWQVAVNACGTCAYVVARKDQLLVRIEDIDTATPVVGPSVGTGSEPTGVALSPNNTAAYVANWVEGTVDVVDPLTMQVVSSLDLNQALLDTGLLGASVSSSRPALAHPRALAVTNDGDGDDTDERVLVTEWFAQRTEAELNPPSNADVSHDGLVYSIATDTEVITTIALPAIADAGFANRNGEATGCYPNQIGSVTIDGSFAYVTSTCASPRGPTGVFQPNACTPSAFVDTCPDALQTCFNGTCAGANVCTAGNTCPGGLACIVDAVNGNRCPPVITDVKTTTHPALHVIDLGDDSIATATTLDRLFDAPAVASARMPLLPTDIGFRPGFAYVTSMGADAAFRLTVANGLVTAVGSPVNDFINLRRPTNDTDIRLPIGIAVANGSAVAFVSNEGTRDVTALELNAQAIAGDQASDFRILSASALPASGSPEETVLRGKRFFDTGLGRWSLAGGAWGSCAACHIDGLTDNVTWYFARGPRQSTSLDGTFASLDGTDQRILNWSAIFDEVADFELNVRGVSGGVGAIVSATSAPPVNADRINLTNNAALPAQVILQGSAGDAADPAGVSAHAHSVIDDWAEVTAYLKTVRSPRRPVGLVPADVTAGRTLFTSSAQGNCVGCHSGAKWTISKVFYTPGDGPNAGQGDPAAGSLANKSWNVALNGFPAALFPAATAANRVMRFGGSPGLEQLQCTLRPVGTFGIAPAAVGIAEVRENGAAAQGNQTDGNGFNVPSLLGAQVGGPFFHAGNARTLEEVFDALFAGHHTSAVAAVFAPNATQVRQLVAFVLSIDEDETPVAIPAKGASGGDLCFYP